MEITTLSFALWNIYCKTVFLNFKYTQTVSMSRNSDGFDPTILNTSLTFAVFLYIYKWVGGCLDGGEYTDT